MLEGTQHSHCLNFRQYNVVWQGQDNIFFLLSGVKPGKVLISLGFFTQSLFHFSYLQELFSRKDTDCQGITQLVYTLSLIPQSVVMA